MSDSNTLFAEGLELKERARKPQSDPELFRKAATKFKGASSYLDSYKFSDDQTDDIIASKVLSHYYLYEEAYCWYSYYLLNNDLDTCQQMVDLELKEISTALSLIKDDIENVGDVTKMQLLGFLKDWTFREMVSKVKVLEPKAKMNSRKGNFIGALDTYKAMCDKLEKAVSYCLENDLDPTLKRILLGNYFGQHVNVYQMYIGHFKSGVLDDVVKIDILKYFIDSYKVIKKAFEENPEWTEYRKGQSKIRNDIQEFLKDNDNDWPSFLIELNNDTDLILIMKATDINKLKLAKAKVDIENSGLKKLYFTGLFWVIVMCVVAFIIFSIFNSSILWIYQPIAALSVIVLFSVIGAFILRNTQELSEEGFLELMKLSLRIGYRGLKTLDPQTKENSSVPKNF